MKNDTSTLQELMQRAQEVAQELALAQREIADMELTGSAGGGLVTVAIRGDGEVTRVVIDQAAVDEGDAAALSALMLTALRQAIAALRAATTQRTDGITAMLPTALGAHRRSASQQ